jgi:hypothetical protein
MTKNTSCKENKIRRVMKEFRNKKLYSGRSTKRVKNSRQAIAIALSESRKYCPKKRRSIKKSKRSHKSKK